MRTFGHRGRTPHGVRELKLEVRFMMIKKPLVPFTKITAVFGGIRTLAMEEVVATLFGLLVSSLVTT